MKKEYYNLKLLYIVDIGVFFIFLLLKSLKVIDISLYFGFFLLFPSLISILINGLKPIYFLTTFFGLVWIIYVNYFNKLFLIFVIILTLVFLFIANYFRKNKNIK